MTLLLLILIVISAVLHVRAEYRALRSQVYLFKPLTTTLILLLALSGDGGDSRYRLLIGLGLLFSLAGDIFLMLPEDRFLQGLVSFLITHLVYLTAFAMRAAPPAPAQAALIGLPFFLYGSGLLALLWRHLGRMKLPVAAYALIISAMAWQASVWAATGGGGPARYAVIGSVLFVLSDSILAIRRFRRPFHLAQALILSTYFAGQTWIALST